MISKEERAELRLELSNASLGFPLPWRLGEVADVVDADGAAVADCMVENRLTGSNAERYIVAAVNAAPKLLDALDASDEYKQSPLIILSVSDEIGALKARIAELEAAAQWRPIEEAPRDGRRVLVSWGDAYFACFIDGQWRNQEGRGIIYPSHYLPIPEGGAK